MAALVGRQTCASVLLLVGILLCGCGKGGDSNPTPGTSTAGNAGPGNATPEAVFQKWQNATKARDHGAAYDCSSPREQNRLVAVTVIMLRAVARDPRDPAGARDANAILNRYEVKATEPAATQAPGGEDERSAAMAAAVAAAVKDPRGLVAETYALVDAHAKGKPAIGPFADAALSNVQINGDQATGTLTVSIPGKTTTRTMTIAFQKINDVWLVGRFGTFPSK